MLDEEMLFPLEIDNGFDAIQRPFEPIWDGIHSVWCVKTNHKNSAKRLL
ncbi:hypothetical protein [Vibrio vulnificus YJ016]|uniref:Uncharacterized protein n=1 Tax=Vibrio vulnificus (strain YJ016) TaxID=196600 RepID=Q7MEH6_VIBVY|nr:hypothetical protein VVMO6_03688 [Vibrio vulnificus MO6-24/O]BAC96720.1 hypothetical protein [Vibrio vulnificus YJ016]